MNREQARSLIAQTFTRQFDKSRFRNFAVNLLNRIDESKAFARNSQYIKQAFKDHVNRFERLGTYISPDNETLDLLVVHLTQESKLERARTAIRNFVADHLKERNDKDAALVAFVSPAEKQWRFSYVRMDYAAVEKEPGKVGVETRLTPARRFSYIVGEGESCHTAQTRFLGLLQRTEADPALADIQEAFSVEAVTKEFYKKYAELFEGMHKALDRLAGKDKNIREEFTAKSVNSVDFAKKLMGQIVFLYFLQKKGWLGVARGEDWGTGPRDFLRKLANGEYGRYDNFFNDILEPLFYDTLATDRGHEAWCKQFKCRIPFLNGGLFEPLGDYSWRKIDILLPDKLFTNSEFIEEGIAGSGVLDVFDRYNFTVNEAEPLEKEVAIDPEMLGKVFENLIEENRRKGLGAYYTPREIVHYMCQESLVNYLDTALNNDKQTVPCAEIETFVHLGEQISHYEAAERDYPHIKMPKSIEKHARLIDEKLADITVCDPAVGSGAFPVGMMMEIVRARCALTPYFNDFHERTPYHFKRHAIQNCLYGVDIDPGAVEIAKLRLWLSLVVDEEETKQIKPLPNLDYKIVAGNSLVGFPQFLFKPPRLQEIEKLKLKVFDEPDHDAKAKLKKEIDNELRACFAASKESLGYEVNFDFHIFFSEVFRKAGGFDITIGNPPYVRADKQMEEHKRQRELIKASRQYETLWEKWDIFVPFIERAYKLLRPDGISSMIVSDAFCHSKYAEKPQKWLLANARVVRLDFCSDLKIFEAAIHNVIYFLQKGDGAQNRPERRLHSGTFGNVIQLPSDEQAKLTYRTFFPEKSAKALFTACVVPIGQICYVSFGCRPNSNEKIAKGLFVAADLVSQRKDKSHPKPYIEAKDIERWTYQQYRWLEWGTERSPKLLTRPTFEELFQAPEKIVAADVSGAENRAAYDPAQVFHSHTLISFVPWRSLHGVRNNSLKKSARYKSETPPRPDLPKREELEALSRRFAVKYLLGVMNSTAARDFLRANRRSNIHLYPDDWKKLPIPDVDATAQAPISTLVDRILGAKRCDPGAEVAEWEREIDRLVYDLYGLTAAEIKLVEESMGR